MLTHPQSLSRKVKIANIHGLLQHRSLSPGGRNYLLPINFAAFNQGGDLPVESSDPYASITPMNTPSSDITQTVVPNNSVARKQKTQLKAIQISSQFDDDFDSRDDKHFI